MIKGYPHFAHCDKILVSVGQIVSPGEHIAELGNTGNSTAAHCHSEFWKNDPRLMSPKWWTHYTSGMNMAQVEARYYRPSDYLAGKVYPVVGGYTGKGGYVFGQVNADGQIHPGDDINAGPGSTDIGADIVSPEWAEVIGVFDDGGGFGRHIYLRALSDEEIAEHNKPTKRYMKIATTGQMIWVKQGDVTEFWVIYKKDDGSEVKRAVKSHITLCAEVFANNDQYRRWSTPEQMSLLAGYPEGKEYDITEQFKNHPELFEKQ